MVEKKIENQHCEAARNGHSPAKAGEMIAAAVEMKAQKASPQPQEAQAELAKPVWSSGVAFYPPSDKYWRIGGKWYDFEPFLDKHPGGATVLRIARDRFEDCTFVFEAHHHNYRKVRAIIQKYEVPEERVVAAGLRKRPARDARKHPGHHDSVLDADPVVKLLGHDAFYSVLRTRVAEYLREIGHPDGGPTRFCIALFYVSAALAGVTFAASWYTGSFLAALLQAMNLTLLGAYGHNWVHQPKYKLWADFCLYWLGFSSDAWFREHNLQHHMYTNTPWDNHFKGTAPFLITDPTVKRNWLQRAIMPYCTPLLLQFGIYANWAVHAVEIVKGNEELRPGKFAAPVILCLMILRWGLLKGALLQHVTWGLAGLYYFTWALMNHNAKHCHDVSTRNQSSDWGVSQLNSSADWSTGCSFMGAIRYLWLNFHTVHHLFPHVCVSHHPAIQRILVKTCDEFGISYHSGEPWTIFCEMLRSFSTPSALMQEILVYAGGI